LRGDEEGGRRGYPHVVAAAAHRRRHRCPSPSPTADEKVPFEDTTEAVVVEAGGGSGGSRHRCPSPSPAADDVGFLSVSPKKVPFEDTTEAVVVEAEAAARWAMAACGSGTAAGYEGVHGVVGGRERWRRGIVVPI